MDIDGSGDIADITSPALERAKERDLIQKDIVFKAKHYGELKPGTPPIMIGGGSNRQVSSGNDFGAGKGGFRALDRRDVSGKIAEEGRGGNDGGKGWGTRFRKVSGL